MNSRWRFSRPQAVGGTAGDADALHDHLDPIGRAKADAIVDRSELSS